MTRLVSIALGLALLACLGLAAYQESRAPWRLLLEKYQRIDPKGAARLPIQLPTADGELDRCPTCHQGVLPHKKQLPAGPLSAHPVIPGHEDLSRFGCTPCHGGQGRRLDMLAHAPALGDGPRPFLGAPLIQARCARCHVPTGLAGAPELDRGFKEYLEAGCTGCHQPGREEEGLGPDLRLLGRRTEKELREVLLDPGLVHASSVMWSFSWRYDQKTAEGRRALDALITALLAMGEPTASFRASWFRPEIRTDQPCTTCHRPAEGGKAAAGAGHRCTLLRQSQELSCPRCHHKDAPLPGGKHQGICPQIQAARPLCGVCHYRAAEDAGALKR